MKALSIRQPWAHLILQGIKTIEYRSWRTDYRGPLVIHVAKRRDDFEQAARRYQVAIPDELPSGGFVGLVELFVIEATGDPDPQKRWGWILRNPRRIPFQAAPGRLSLFTPPPDIIA